jgi:hypothetical protein
VVAVDPDGERLKVAREKYQAASNVIECSQANDKTLPTTSLYDSIFYNDWNSDSIGFECMRYLRPVGQFAATGQKLKTELAS